jgi:hypothetical protein
MKIKNDKGCTFLVRVVNQGDSWGRNDCLVHDEPDPLIEFYQEADDGDPPRGHFVCNYFASTLAEHTDGRGLALFGGAPELDIDAEALAPVIALAREIQVRK